MPAMGPRRLARTLALIICAMAVFNTLSALSLPVAARRPAPWLAALWCVLLLVQAALFWFGEPIRARMGIVVYLGMQIVVIATIGITGALVPVSLALLAALTAETVVLAGERWGTLAITLTAIILFGAIAIAASNIYQGATAALVLAAVGLVAHAVVAVSRRDPVAALAPASGPGAGHSNGGANLTDRERDVLRLLVTGARTSEIAGRLGIAERTVKAHLGSIYRKLGVDSRAAAVAAALRHDLLS
jgi:DNA-binding CsgD family transcriptional regulator